MHDTEQILEAVREIIVAQLDVEPELVTEDATFADDLGADSLDLVELMLGLEDKFGIKISDEEAALLKTVGNVVDYIESHLEA